MSNLVETLFENEMLVVIIAEIIGFILFVTFYLNTYLPFMEDRKYLKMEMNRSSSESERNFWKKKLRRLYLRSIPIIGRFIK